MKISLVVASGVHEGKAIPITGTQFVIGRDPQCQLRPASQAVSKQHCAILVQENRIVIKDYGSTNGTIVNEETVRGEERVISHNDRVKVGPLDFTVRIDTTATHKALGSASPSEGLKKKADEALAAVQSVVETAPSKAAGLSTPGRKTPAPASDSKSATRPTKSPAASKPTGEPSNDDIAAMLLGIGEEESSEKVPDGSTVMEVSVEGGLPAPADAASSKPAASKSPSREDTSNAASEILRKMLRRPR